MSQYLDYSVYTLQGNDRQLVAWISDLEVAKQLASLLVRNRKYLSPPPTAEVYQGEDLVAASMICGNKRRQSITRVVNVLPSTYLKKMQLTLDF